MGSNPVGENQLQQNLIRGAVSKDMNTQNTVGEDNEIDDQSGNGYETYEERVQKVDLYLEKLAKTEKPGFVAYSNEYPKAFIEDKQHLLYWPKMKVPDLDQSGRVTGWTTYSCTTVEPYVHPDPNMQQEGSGILDTDPATHHHIRLVDFRDPPKINKTREEQRKMYLVSDVEDDPNVAIENDPDCDTDNDTESEAQSESSYDLDIRKVRESLAPASGAASSSLSTGVDLSKLNIRELAERHTEATFIGPKSKPMQLSVTISSSDSGSIYSSESGLTSPTSAATSTTDADDVLNLEELWTSMQAEVVGTLSTQGDPSSEYSHVSPPPVGLVKTPNSLENLPGSRTDKVPNDNLEIVITFDKYSNIRLQTTRDRMLVKHAGCKTREYPITSADSVARGILLSHRITSVKCVGKSGPGERPASYYDINWFRRFAWKALNMNFPTFQYYAEIQQRANGNISELPNNMVNFIWHSPPKLIPWHAKHYLLRSPLGMQGTFANSVSNPAAERNLSVSQFMKRVYIDSKGHEDDRRLRWYHMWGIHRSYVEVGRVASHEATMIEEWPRSEHTVCPEGWDHYGVNGGPGTEFDLQQIPWTTTLCSTRAEMLALRSQTYHPFDNIGGMAYMKRMRPDITRLPETLNAVTFMPKSMHTAHHPTFSHYQLRNMVACRNQHQLIYADGAHSRVFTTVPYLSSRNCVIDLGSPNNSTAYAEPVKISTLALSTDRDRSIVVVGGMDGEMAVRNLDLIDHEIENDPGVTFDWATKNNADCPGIVNQIDIDWYASKGQFQAVLACNDRKVRTYDIQTGTWLHGKGDKDNGGTNTGWSYPWAINCTAACPDGKLRVIVGDTPDVCIISTDTGRCERILAGHEDWGFACAWSPDCLNVATANQDGIVNIYDTRTWRRLAGFRAHRAGFRSLKFSPVGGGVRALMCVEPADRVTMVNAKYYDEAETQSFFGEIAGADFVADGSGFWVGNADDTFGGFMEYERGGYGQVRGLDFQMQPIAEANAESWVDPGPEEWIYEEDRFKDVRCVDPARNGRAGNWMRDHEL